MTDTDHQAQERARATEAKEAVKKRLADERAAREKEHVARRSTTSAVKPTPTQEENDLAASGVHVVDKEPDGSPPDTGITPLPADGTSTRQVEAKKPAAAHGDYQTRTATPKP